MLGLTSEGVERSERLWHQLRKDEEEVAFLAAADILDEYPIADAYDLANHLPFVHGIERKTGTVRKWMDDGLIEKTRSW